MSASTSDTYVSRGGDKLAAALNHFRIDATGHLCADLGSHVGGFVDCLLRHGAAKVYSVDTSYGTLAWTLRKDERVVVLERTNAMHVSLPESVDLVTIDAGWTKQSKILPNAAKLLNSASTGLVLTLIKPHYEANKKLLVDGVLPDQHRGEIVDKVLEEIESTGWRIDGTFESPIPGHGGNHEVFALLSTCLDDR
jgi:23S rRNA (cytidine1920-2'-O)/16S rRNA (cytidine1409-2'-O)-methyltransferase